MIALPAVLAVAAAVALTIAPPAAAQQPRPAKVVVSVGDTLSDIAVKFYGSPDAVDRILAANKLVDPNLIMAGTTLVLPAEAATAAAVGGAAAAGGPSTRTVTVEPGDTLSAISTRVYGTPAFAGAIAAANGINDPNLVFAGLKLTVPASPTATTPAAGGAAVSPAPGGPLAGKVICLDPGHGGAAEPGAVFQFGDGRVLREADVVLDVAKTLRAWLQADGATVVMTRTTDLFLGLDARAYLCNTAGADITVSLHLNGGDDPMWNGSLALYFKAVDQRLSNVLSLALQSGLGKNAPGVPFYDYGSRSFQGAVLLQTAMPAVIVEPVFLTNPAEARALQATTAEPTSRRNQIVLETYRGIRMFFGR